jgi:hypothetical protein
MEYRMAVTYKPTGNEGVLDLVRLRMITRLCAKRDVTTTAWNELIRLLQSKFRELVEARYDQAILFPPALRSMMLRCGYLRLQNSLEARLGLRIAMSKVDG